MTWRDTEDIAIALSEGHPDLDPLTVRFTDLHRWVTELPGFTDDPKASNEKLLEASLEARLLRNGVLREVVDLEESDAGVRRRRSGGHGASYRARAMARTRAVTSCLRPPGSACISGSRW